MSGENNEESTRDKTTQDFLTGLKEREELKSKLLEKERECNRLNGNIYDMTKKVEDLEKQVSYSQIVCLSLCYVLVNCVECPFPAGKQGVTGRGEVKIFQQQH